MAFIDLACNTPKFSFCKRQGSLLAVPPPARGFLHSMTLWRLVSMRVCMRRRVQLCVNASMYPRQKLSIIQRAHDEGMSSERGALGWDKNLSSLKGHTHPKRFRSRFVNFLAFWCPFNSCGCHYTASTVQPRQWGILRSKEPPLEPPRCRQRAGSWPAYNACACTLFNPWSACCFGCSRAPGKRSTPLNPLHCEQTRTGVFRTLLPWQLVFPTIVFVCGREWFLWTLVRERAFVFEAIHSRLLTPCHPLHCRLV